LPPGGDDEWLWWCECWSPEEDEVCPCDREGDSGLVELPLPLPLLTVGETAAELGDAEDCCNDEAADGFSAVDKELAADCGDGGNGCRVAK
jgi:hypothetical protein